MTLRTFVGRIERPDDGPGHAIAVPFDPARVFGRARAPVLVVIGDHPAFRTTLASYGGHAWIGLRKAQLSEFGLETGAEVAVTVERDDQPRTVDVPAELAAALEADAASAAAYAGLPFSHRREYAQWVGEAKRAQTRSRRAAATVEWLRARPGGSAG
ncbi:MAG TPA: YdeI/OmpD-associated family protein [Nakamurella sp.]|jgi:hypothetical protein|nr:YdeI/OmpD-associated family protein [Nakamurella sp.]